MAVSGAKERKKKRLVVLATHPIQYYVPLYRQLANRGNLDIHVVFLSDAGAQQHEEPEFGRVIQWDVPLLDGYPYTILQPGTSINKRNFLDRYDRSLTDVLSRLDPDWILVYGYAARMNWVASHWANKKGIKIVYTSDSNIRDPKRRYFTLLKQGVLRAYFSKIDRFLSVSDANEAYLKYFGVKEEKIRRVPFAIELNRYNNKEKYRDDAKYDFIWAGKMIPIKRPKDMLLALASIAEEMGRPVTACMVGDGPLRKELELEAARLPKTCLVDFLGFVNQSEMPAVLMQAKSFVFSSEREAYGVIALEAAAAGLALIVADNIGCVGDSSCVRPGENALTYRCGDIAGLAKQMVKIKTDHSRVEHMQKASMGLSRMHDVRHVASLVEAALS